MKQRISNLLAYLALTLFIISCFEAKNTALDNNQILYFGGDILTMQGTEPNYVEAIVTNADSIVFIGRLSESKELFPSVREVNLNGKTLLPGFIDAHAHFAGFPSQSIGAQILPPPDAGANNISSLIKILNAGSTPENIQLTGWIFGMGFDDLQGAEAVHTRHHVIHKDHIGCVAGQVAQGGLTGIHCIYVEVIRT